MTTLAPTILREQARAHVLLRRADEGPRRSRAVARDTRAAVDDFLRTTQWRIVVPGQHYSGLSNQELFEVREAEGREFLLRTTQLDVAMRPKLRSYFTSWARVPTLAEIREAYSSLVIEWIVSTRFEAGGGDLALTPLTVPYALEKGDSGYGGEPIGVRTGAHRDALRDRGRLEFTT